METAFGRDFSSVEAFTGQPEAMNELGASAATHGNTVAFADSSPSPWLVAHELAHVVQNDRAGGGAGISMKATIAPSDSAAESEADSVADRVTSGGVAGAITATPAAPIQRFAPKGHRQSTVEGLKGSFSAEEIGAIYASNWERDFSQGNADIASATIAWTAVKNHAAKNNGDPGPAAATFQAAVWKVVNGNLLDSGDESLGTYKYWEHMDQPDNAPAAEKRWAKKSDGLAGYIADSKAFIQDQMVAAIDLYRQLHHLDSVGGGIDNWKGAAKPEGYVPPKVTSTGQKVTSTLPANFDDKNVASRDPIREQTATEAKAAGAKTDPKHHAGQWKIIGQHLGRAMHPFQDFWSHSNWLELAKEKKAKVKAGGSAVAGAAANQQLKTGTFKRPAQAHALGHKLHALASGLKHDSALLLKIYGRTAPSTKLDSKEAQSQRSTPWGGNGILALTDHQLAYNALRVNSKTPNGEIMDVGDATNNVEELVLSGKYKMEDFLCNPSWLEALEQKGRYLIEEGDAKSDADSHGKIAKDQHEGDGHKDFETAIKIAAEADRLVFAPLRAIMDQKDAGKALQETQKQLDLVGAMLQAPTPSHPLWKLVP